MGCLHSVKDIAYYSFNKTVAFALQIFSGIPVDSSRICYKNKIAANKYLCYKFSKNTSLGFSKAQE